MGWFGKKKRADDGGPRTAFVHSKNMHLKVAAPQGDGWKIMEARGGGRLLAALKCLHGAPPKALALDAMLYGVDPEDLPSLSQLRERDWRRHFLDKMFSEIEDLTQREVEHRARGGGFVDTGIEVEVAGTLREPAMPLVVVERHVPLTKHLLLVSAAGAPAERAGQAALIDVWLNHATLGER
ncbi:MAG TPA: hypothetical protein ENK57_01470 [Polyangiaceae bacterium]|nr:hypothetical protein [Polyangiaceae bacterium]